MSCPYHGAGSCKLSAMNWKVCDTDVAFHGALQSWKEITKYNDMLDTLLELIDQLFRYGPGPIIWLDTEDRAKAPIYLVSHHGDGIRRHACYQLWGCRYCRASTNQLYHAHWDYDMCLAARREVVAFLQPMLSLLPAFQNIFTGRCVRDRLRGDTPSWAQTQAQAQSTATGGGERLDKSVLRLRRLEYFCPEEALEAAAPPPPPLEEAASPPPSRLEEPAGKRASPPPPPPSFYS